MCINCVLIKVYGYHFSVECPDSSLPGHTDPSVLKPISRTESDSSGCSDSSSSADSCSCGSETASPAPVPSEWAYVVLLSLLFALVALSARRFSYLWVPQACVVGGAGVASGHAWRAGLEKLGFSGRMVGGLSKLNVKRHFRLYSHSLIPSLHCQLLLHVGKKTCKKKACSGD